MQLSFSLGLIVSGQKLGMFLKRTLCVTFQNQQFHLLYTQGPHLGQSSLYMDQLSLSAALYVASVKNKATMGGSLPCHEKTLEHKEKM